MLRSMHVNLHFVIFYIIKIATIHQSLFAGKVAITLSVESMSQKEETKLKECAKDSPLNLCSQELDNLIALKISEYLVKCIQPDQRIFIVHAFQVSEDKDIESIA
jgi:hypothetical protein